MSRLITARAELWIRSTPEALSYREVSGWSGPLVDDSLKTDGGLGPAFSLSPQMNTGSGLSDKGASGNLTKEIAIDPCPPSQSG